MDLGCIDMGCVEKDTSPKEPTVAASKLGKKNKAKDALRSSSNALSKLTSQISKPPRRKTSPLNWFPRKKVEPYLKRKLKMLQEVDGMHLTLDETLEDSNPHYSRVLREKIAIREAAEKAIEARKSAMVEASWCRILHAAGIESKEAEEQLSKAELSSAEAFEAARAVGVIMNDKPDSSQNRCRIETVSAKVGSRTHTVSATFETAFAVDKQVAAAVKAAFVKLANCHSINKEEFKELLHKISENPDTDETCSDLSAIDSGADSDMDSLKKENKRAESERFNTVNIVDMMLGRLQCLKEDELASLATIVATSGLNAALAESEKFKQQQPLTNPIKDTENRCPNISRREKSSEIPSLDRFLVKRLSRLEREVLEAKNARKREESDDKKLVSKKNKDDSNAIPELGSVMRKHSSKLEREIEEARKNVGLYERVKKQGVVDVDVPSLDKYLVKRLTRLEREVEEARNRPREDQNCKRKDEENSADCESLDKVVVKHVSRLEKEKMQQQRGELGEEDGNNRYSVCRRVAREKELQAAWGGLSLGNSMRPHVSRLQQDKADWLKAEEEERNTALAPQQL